MSNQTFGFKLSDQFVQSLCDWHFLKLIRFGIYNRRFQKIIYIGFAYLPMVNWACKIVRNLLLQCLLVVYN